MHERAGTRVALSSTMRRRVTGFALVIAAVVPTIGYAQTLPKLDIPLTYRATLLTGRSPVIVQPLDTGVDVLLQSVGGTLGRALPIIDARVAVVPNVALPTLAGSALVQRLALDRKTLGLMERTGPTIGATAVRQTLGYDGTGIGVAVIDSGITAWHDDLTDAAAPASQRVARFVDFVGGQTHPYDDYGHGTHVAGIIAGNGYDSSGARPGVAPGANLVVLKALDGSGSGRISDLIAALNYVIDHQGELNIRVVNLSIGAGVYESYNSDVLAQATRRVVERGVVVVSAAGNNGHTSSGQTQYGGITSPGNAPWVLTVGAASHMGTIDRADDVVASFSSRGPTRYDDAAKPDVVAPGVGIESLSVPNSQLSSTYSAYLLNGTIATAFPPYLSLTGTSMATPVVTGTVALMLQANPALTPNAVKAIVQYTAQPYAGYDALTEGAGFLDAAGAVALAQYFANPTGAFPSAATWSAQIIWGNQRVRGGRPMPGTNAWRLDTTWGAAWTASGVTVVWGVECTTSSCGGNSGPPPAAWGATCSDATCNSVTWGNDSNNVVWAQQCGGSDCSGQTWSTGDSQTVVWGTSADQTVVWGTSDSETVVWGTSCGHDCDPVIWNR